MLFFTKLYKGSGALDIARRKFLNGVYVVSVKRYISRQKGI
jgi:hypothetical protein